MFIEEIMKKIWSGPTAEHASLEAYYSKKSAEEVYRDLIEEINNTEELLQYKSGFFFYNLPDRGCDICNRDGTFVSCSFCDMISMNLKVTLMSSILRKKDTYLYSKAIIHALKKNMSRVKDIPDIRFITGFNTLSENELPDVFVDMLSKEAAEIKKSRLCAFDTRADSVKPERLRKWKNLFGENTGVNIGVESSNEWLRNHWIGKKIRNGSLKNAVDIIKSEDMLSSMSILLGIPGLSELQSIAVFLDSLDFVISLNPDRIVLSPTMCQKYTLQNYIKDNFRTEEHVFRGLNDINSSRWVISIYSVYVSCRIAVKLYPHFSDKIMLNPEFFYSYFFEDHYLEYAEEDEKDIMRKIMKLLNECIRCGNFNSLYDENSEIINNPVFVRYFQNLNMQDSPSEIKKTILFTGQTLINKMDFSAKTNLYIKLKNEIKNFSYIPKYSWDDIDRLLNK